MSQNASERIAQPSARIRAGAKGFTLVEVLVAMVVAVLLGVATVRFYKDSYHTYSQQEQIADRNQNAHFTLSKLTEVLQQAGSALPDTGWAVISISKGALTVGVNPRGVEQFNGTDMPPSNFIPVSDASLFKNTGNVFLNTTRVLVDFADPANPTVKLAIDAAYNSNGFVNGIKDNATDMDSIRVTKIVDLSMGDKIYGYRDDQYLLVGGNLVVRPDSVEAKQMTLSENIDSVGYTFLDAAGSKTTIWKQMRSASITVRARTERPDPKLKVPGYHKITLPMNIILRNKI
jgi:prepilin-type N-terminal cleavage/methylation domain-containing protein